jgi:hypothetical protein
MRNGYGILVGEPESRAYLEAQSADGRTILNPNKKWGVDLAYLATDGEQWCKLVITAMSTGA